MQFTSARVFGRLFPAALGLAATAALAATGFQVTKKQETLVAPGMTMDQVQTALGRPAQNVKYRNEPGRTFTYQVLGTDDQLFDVDFSADGRVASTNERYDEVGGGSAGGHHGGRR